MTSTSGAGGVLALPAQRGIYYGGALARAVARGDTTPR